MKTACKTLMIISIILCILSMILAPIFKEADEDKKTDGVTGVYFTDSYIQLYVGDSINLYAKTNPPTDYSDITFYSNTSAVRVYDYGRYCRVYAQTQGTAYVYAEVNGFVDHCIIYIY